MRIILVESTTAAQAATARKLGSIDRIDRDTLDLSIGLADEESVFGRLDACDVLIVGASVGKRSLAIAKRAKDESPHLEIIILVPAVEYAAGAFRSALSCRVRRVFSDAAPTLDLVQELMGIQEEFRNAGKVRPSRVIAVVQAKGGLGATSTCAALASVCGAHGQSTILWDLDIETRDLCRALTVDGDQSSVVTKMVQGEVEISRETLRQALMRVSDRVSVLPPPDHVAACIDLVGGIDSLDLIHAILNTARLTHDTVIVDLGGRMGPAAAAILRHADAVLVAVDDSLLGLSAARFFLPTLQSVIRSPESLFFLCSGISISKTELSEHLDFAPSVGAKTWSLPIVPFDAAASTWPGSGKTLYELGKRQTRLAFEGIAETLALIERKSEESRSFPSFSRVLDGPAASISTALSVAGFLTACRVLWSRGLN
jgi:Flp pilus assembly CpaE family ATPase